MLASHECIVRVLFLIKKREASIYARHARFKYVNSPEIYTCKKTYQ